MLPHALAPNKSKGTTIRNEPSVCKISSLGINPVRVKRNAICYSMAIRFVLFAIIPTRFNPGRVNSELRHLTDSASQTKAIVACI